MSYLYAISRGKGTLVESGKRHSIGETSEVFDEYVSDTKSMAVYSSDKSLQHVKKGKWSMTIMPEGYVH